MRCPYLSELPPSPPDNTAWPWTATSPHVADVVGFAGAPLRPSVRSGCRRGFVLSSMTIRFDLGSANPRMGEGVF